MKIILQVLLSPPRQGINSKRYQSLPVFLPYEKGKIPEVKQAEFCSPRLDLISALSWYISIPADFSWKNAAALYLDLATYLFLKT